MSDNPLAITFADSSRDATMERRFVHLEQVKDEGFNETVSMYDIQQMVARAKGGTPALSYASGCSAHIDGDSVVAQFDFYAWPSRTDLPYAITTSLGTVSDASPVDLDVEFSATFELSDAYEFDFILSEITSYEWETECYDSYGRVVDPPEPTMDGFTTMVVPSPIFGVVRIKGVKRGAKFQIESRLVRYMEVPPDPDDYEDSGYGRHMTYSDFMGMYFNYSRIDTWTTGDNQDNSVPEDIINLTGIKIDSLKVTATSHWVDFEGNEAIESLQMEVPQCMQDLLAMCDGDEDTILNGGYWWLNPNGVPNDPCGDGSGQEPPTLVYVSSCTGEVLGTGQPDDDDTSWCGK